MINEISIHESPGMLMDMDRIILENFNDVLYVEACMGDEFTLDDLNIIRDEIRKNYSAPADIIFKETGSYSVAGNVQKLLWKGIEEFMNVVYVAETESKKTSARYAAETYMSKYNARLASTKEAAYTLLSNKSK